MQRPDISSSKTQSNTYKQCNESCSVDPPRGTPSDSGKVVQNLDPSISNLLQPHLSIIYRNSCSGTLGSPQTGRKNRPRTGRVASRVSSAGAQHFRRIARVESRPRTAQEKNSRIPDNKLRIKHFGFLCESARFLSCCLSFPTQVYGCSIDPGITGWVKLSLLCARFL